MSHKPRKSRRKKCELENEKPTRRSARLNNCWSDCSLNLQTLERRKIGKFQRNINSCPTVITRSRTRLVESIIHSHCSKPDESSITDEYSTENNSDSDRNCVIKTLTFSSSDSTASEEKTCKRSKASSNGYDANEVVKKRVNGGQCSKEEISNGEVLRSSTVKKSYNLRSRSHRAAESGSETPSVLEVKITVEKKSQKKTKFEEKVFINNKSTKPSLSWDQEKEVKKSATKDVKKSVERDLKKSVEKNVKKGKKTGTLARKRELRDMLEQQDEGYEDDAFEGTPFRNRKSVLKCKLSPVILDTSVQSISTDTEFRTPFSRTPVNRLRPAGPLSSGTSESDTMTPGLLNSFNRNNIDRYVNQLRRRKFHLGCKKKLKSHTPVSKKHSRNIQTKSFYFDTNSIAQKFTTTTECENDDDDYYWSDIE